MAERDDKPTLSIPPWVQELAVEWETLAARMGGTTEGPCATYRNLIAATLLDAARILRQRAEDFDGV